MATSIIPEVTKRIAYNKETKDYDCFIAFDGTDEQPIGSASTYGDAEKKCNAYAFDYYNDNHTPEKAVQVALVETLPDADNTYHYMHGSASLDVQEDSDGTILSGRLVINSHVIPLAPADFAGIRDLACLLHDHDAQNTIGTFSSAAAVPDPLTLARTGSSYRSQFDNGAVHETEGYLYQAMLRMGLSNEAMADLFGHVVDLMGTVYTQASIEGYEDGIGRRAGLQYTSYREGAAAAERTMLRELERRIAA